MNPRTTDSLLRFVPKSLFPAAFILVAEMLLCATFASAQGIGVFQGKIVDSPESASDSPSASENRAPESASPKHNTPNHRSNDASSPQRDSPRSRARQKTWLYIQGRNGNLRRVSVEGASIKYDEDVPANARLRRPADSLEPQAEVRVTAKQGADGEWQALEITIIGTAAKHEPHKGRKGGPATGGASEVSAKLFVSTFPPPASK